MTVVPRRARPATAILVLAIVAGALAAPAAGDEGAVVLSPAGGETLVAGSFFLVRWTAPAAAEELELMLLPDHGPTREVRLTGQLDPTSGWYLWQVPELPQRAARLRIRWGADGVETPGPAGGEFTIVAASRAAALDLHWHSGEWWLTRNPSPAALATLPARVGAAPGPGSDHADVAGTPPRGWSLALPAGERTLRGDRLATSAATASPALDLRPLLVPLRC